MTVILLTCSYFSREFVRVGYYVNNEYADDQLRETPPTPPQFDKVVRNILADQPRVTRFPIAWTKGLTLLMHLLLDGQALILLYGRSTRA